MKRTVPPSDEKFTLFKQILSVANICKYICGDIFNPISTVWGRGGLFALPSKNWNFNARFLLFFKKATSNTWCAICTVGAILAEL